MHLRLEEDVAALVREAEGQRRLPVEGAEHGGLGEDDARVGLREPVDEQRDEGGEGDVLPDAAQEEDSHLAVADDAVAEAGPRRI